MTRSFPGVLLVLFEDGSIAGLPPTPPVLHDFSKMMKIDLATASTHSAPVDASHQGPMDLWVISLSSLFLTHPSTTKGRLPSFLWLSLT